MSINILETEHTSIYGDFPSADRLFNHFLIQAVRMAAWTVLVLMSFGVLVFVGLMVRESIRKHREALKDDEFNASDIDIEAGITSSYVDQPPQYADADAAPPAYTIEREGEVAPPAYCESVDEGTIKTSSRPALERGILLETHPGSVASAAR